MHSCPVCDSACYCSGDFEDHDVGDELVETCEHCDDEIDCDDDDALASSEGLPTDTGASKGGRE